MSDNTSKTAQSGSTSGTVSQSNPALPDTDNFNPQSGQLSVLEFSRSHTTIRSSPLPSVEEFAGYEAVHKGAAGEILSMAISAQKHRQWMDKSHQIFDFMLRLAGICLTAALMAGLIFAAYSAAISDHPIVAGLFGAGGALAVGGALRHYQLRQDNASTPQTKPKRKPRKT